MIIVAAVLAAYSTQASAQVTDPKVWAWDFPMYMEINVEPGQEALTCQMHYFQEVKEGQGLLKKTMIWYDTKIDAPGKETEHTARKTVMMKSVGIISLADFSMPDCTPLVMT